MKRIRNFVLFFVAFTLLYACRREGHTDFVMVNKSNRDIGCQRQPSTSENGFLCNDGALCISSDSSFNFSAPDSGRKLRVWEDYLKHHKYIQILITDCDTFWEYRSKPCDTIHKYVPILHVYRLTLEDLERMDWKVIYPPVE
ncbi:hypothetical protein M1B74_03625 [Bacteroides pyogenes]|uniref:hypothetical protein n=1 Tax=Bacteroides pyogenes TaxID=310300 RepID=UPI003B43074C